jgi:hypothetical protein
MDLTFLAEIVERKSAGYPGDTEPGGAGDNLERSIGELLDGARGRLSAAALFSLRAVLVGAVAELRRHHDMHAAT